MEVRWGRDPLLYGERLGAFLRIARGRGWEIGWEPCGEIDGDRSGRRRGISLGGGTNFFLWWYCIYKTILYL